MRTKHWKGRPIGVARVRELWGVLADERATGAVFVTSGTFSAQAVEFSIDKALELVDGGRLRQMLAAAKAGRPAQPNTAVDTQIGTPTCPKCGATMVLRTAHRGERAGQQFWGCSTYPRCTGSRQLAVAAR